MNKKTQNRTSQGLRDILFDELADLRSGRADPTKSLAVAHIAKQIVSTAKVELEFAKATAELAEKGSDLVLGQLQLGS